MEEKQLVTRALDDHSAFKILVERYYPVMLAVAKSIIGDSLAEEVVQEAWLSAYSNLSKFEISIDFCKSLVRSTRGCLL